MTTAKKYIKDAYMAIFSNDFNRAIYGFVKAIEIEPDNASYHYKLSVTYARNGKLGDAIQSAQIANQLQPNHPIYELHVKTLQAASIVGRAIDLYTREGTSQSDLVIKFLNQAITLNPLHIEAYYWLGVVYYELLHYSQSDYYLREALKLNPSHRGANDLLLKTSRKMKQWQ